MVPRGELSAICIALTAWCCCAVTGWAQEPPARPSSGGAEGAAAEPALIRLPWDWSDIRVLERRYKIEALRFKARDETGADWSGSDEVMIKTTDAEGWTASDKIENIDSGDTHNVDPAKSCIIAVRPGEAVLGRTSVCDGVGRPAPLWFEVEMWEDEEVPLFEFDYGCLFGPDHFGPYCVPTDGDDDFIGHARLEFSAQELEAALPNVGDEFVETVVLNPCEHGTECGGGWPTGLPDYSFTYRITRMPNGEVDMREIINAAMRRSGARSELEAIIAGLRSLRAPEPRPIEPEESAARRKARLPRAR
jgi:hypothetical protein